MRGYDNGLGILVCRAREYLRVMASNQQVVGQRYQGEQESIVGKETMEASVR